MTAPTKRARALATTLGLVALAMSGAASPAGAAPSRHKPNVTQSCPHTGIRTQAGDEPLSDIDGDGFADQVVGIPDHGPSGIIDVHGSRSGNHATAGTSIAGIFASTQFGSAIAQLDIDRDGCEDLAVGDPDRAGGGAVDFVFGSSSGLRTIGAIQILARTNTDLYGSAVAVDRRLTTAGVTTATDLWVGAPGRTVNGLAGAGAIDHYLVSKSGQATFVESITQASPAAHSTPAAGAHFGSVLSATSVFTTGSSDQAAGVLAGTPDAPVSGLAGAGSATWLLAAGSTPGVTAGQTFTQDTAGVPGGSEAGDHFGAAVSTLASFAVGVPDEDIGSIVDAGMVQTFTLDAARLLTPGPSITQETPGVPGASEAGDRFGAALADGSDDVGCVRLWIGVPGEGLGTTTHAGDVIEQQMCADDSDGPPPVVYTTLRQGSGAKLGGSYETGDEVGSTLGGLTFYEEDGDGADEVLIGDPGEDLGSVTDAGMAIQYGVDTFFAGHQDFTYSGGTTKGQRYATVLAQEIH